MHIPTPENINLKKTKKEFYLLTGILPFHETNSPKKGFVRKDMIFQGLAEKTFDNPKLCDLLDIKIKKWLKSDKSEFTYALTGYISYCRSDFKKAQSYFFQAINSNPYNLDNWFDLAFSLYYQENDKFELAKKF